MPDLLQDLRFGTFITPTAGTADTVVALAEQAEAAGFDLVTVQDHPYQSAFLDTWTLLSFMAARTERVQLAPNVANLPLRPPAVLARASASLDILSHGRFALGLGTGTFWDAIEAMGGGRLSGPESVDALEEALVIIRAIWDTADRSGVRTEGTHYRLRGAKRGPAPAHPLPIWLGAYKPRMLRLTGRSADGWLPSLGYLKDGDLVRGNAIIDDAAREAGRDPAAIRRLLNTGDLPGSVADQVERLTALAAEDGVDTFVVGGDDLTRIDRFAAEVAPAVRRAVAEHRARAAATTPEAAPSVVTPADAAASGLGVDPTPDDGRRLSRLLRWDERERPTMPSPPPDARYSERGRAISRGLVAIHDHLRAELTKVRDLVGQVKEGQLDARSARDEIAELTIRQNDWVMGAYCASYCRLVTTHHSIEDAEMFPHLRTGGADLAAVIDRLEAEHRVIHDVLDEVDEALVDHIGAPGDLARLDAAMDALTDTLLSHLSYEERQLLEPLARLGYAPGTV